MVSPVRIEFVLESKDPRRYRIIVRSIGDVRYARLVALPASPPADSPRAPAR